MGLLDSLLQETMWVDMRTMILLPSLPRQKLAELESVTLQKLVSCPEFEETDTDTGLPGEEHEPRVRNRRGEKTELVKKAGKTAAKVAITLIIAIVLAATGWLCCCCVSTGVLINYCRKRNSEN